MFWEIPSTYLLKYVGKYEYLTSLTLLIQKLSKLLATLQKFVCETLRPGYNIYDSINYIIARHGVGGTIITTLVFARGAARINKFSHVDIT